MRDDNQIVTVGLLSALDVERPGSGFERAYPVTGDYAFADLIGALDRIPWMLRMGSRGERRRPGLTRPAQAP